MTKYCPNCGSEIAEGTRFCLYCGQQIYQLSTLQYPGASHFQQRYKNTPVFSNSKMWIVILFIVISLILSTLSLFFSWYYGRVHITEIEGDESDVTVHMEDKLGEREVHWDGEYSGVDVERTETKDNSELKYDYPDTARCKSVTLALVIIHVLLLIMVLIFVFILFFKPDIKSWSSTKVISLALSFSFIILAYFTFTYDPDEEDDEDEMDIELEQSGNWFYSELKFSGDMVGEGEEGVAGGYILFSLGIISLVLSLFIAISVKKELTKGAMSSLKPHSQTEDAIQDAELLEDLSSTPLLSDLSQSIDYTRMKKRPIHQFEPQTPPSQVPRTRKVTCPYCSREFRADLPDNDKPIFTTRCPDCNKVFTFLRHTLTQEKESAKPGKAEEPGFKEDFAVPVEHKAEKKEEIQMDQDANKDIRSTCLSCGASVESHWMICPYCKTKLIETDEPRPEDYCPACGKHVEPHWNLCPYCGVELK